MLGIWLIQRIDHKRPKYQLYFFYVYVFLNKKINFLLVNQQKFSQLKLVLRSSKKSKQTWRLIFWSFGSYLPKTKIQEDEGMRWMGHFLNKCKQKVETVQCITGHLTTTWTEFCHILTPIPTPCMDSFYILRVEKTNIFWPPPPSSCSRSYWMAPNNNKKTNLENHPQSSQAQTFSLFINWWMTH